MKHPELPANEAQRLKELWRYSLHDTENDPLLDAITQLVASYFDVPIVLVSFLDQDCQWFKSRFGLTEAQTPRNISFCAHAILEDPPIIEIRDARQDPRFCENPLVTGPPHICYYASAKLTTPSGFRIGTLCIIDSQPRDFPATKLEQLSVFAQQVMNHLEMQRLQRLLDIVDKSKVGLWELDVGSNATWWSDTAFDLFASDATASNRRTPAASQYEEASQQKLDRKLAQSAASAQPFSTQLKLKRPVHLPPAWVNVTGVAVTTNNEVTHLAGTIQNITPLKEQEARLARHARIEQLISGLQEEFILDRQTNDTFRHALEKLLRATESEAGFIGEVCYREDSQHPYLKMHALTDISWDKGTFDRFTAAAPAGMEFTRLDSLFGHVILHKETVISNSPATDPRKGGIPSGHPRLDSFMGLPVFDDYGAILAVIGLANRQPGYDAAFALELAPLQYRIGQLITTLNLRKEQQLSRERLEMAAKVFDSSHNAIMITDEENRILDINPVFEAETGYSRQDVLGMKTDFLAAKDHLPPINQSLRKARDHGGYWEGEVLNKRKDGELLPQYLSISVVRNQQGNITHHVVVFTDLRRIKQHDKELYRISHFDPLTHLPNRMHLLQLMHETIRNSKDGIGLVISVIDLDRFNNINQLLGSEAGDALLIEISSRLSNFVSPGETVARMSGDEFGLILRHDDQLLDRLDHLLSNLVTTQPLSNGNMLTITGSMGVTFYPDDNADPDTLLRHADQAMYRAKEEGGNRYVIFNTDHEQELKSAQQLRKDIAHGLQHDEFMLELQPQVNASTLELVGAEALIRWNHPDGRRMPDDFLPHIVNSSLEHDIDKWVIQQAFKLLGQWQRESLELSISVNLTPQTLANKTLISMLDSNQQRYPDVNMGRLHVEILESAAIEELHIATDVMKACQARGVRVALDDFGTGYSSLTYLKGLPADIVKIDRSFVMDMLKNPDDLAIVESVIYLAKRFNKTVVAEGVETDAHIEALYRLGCDVLQGYGIARPMPLDQFTKWRCDRIG
ncbi:EAL domain-containing protein [Halomonas sp. LS-001]